jgi:hypothetical protein
LKFQKKFKIEAPYCSTAALYPPFPALGVCSTAALYPPFPAVGVCVTAVLLAIAVLFFSIDNMNRLTTSIATFFIIPFFFYFVNFF